MNTFLGGIVGYYLIDKPPASRQFWPSRNNGLSGGVVIHTTEGAGGDTAAENTAGFISRRSDPGSYHCIVDTDSTVMMMPDDYVAFGVAASGYNSTCWMIAIAAQSAALDPNSPFTQAEVDRLGAEIVAFWKRNGINIAEASQFIGEGVKDRPGLAHHGDVQPWDRSDAWSRREDRWIFDSMLLQAIERHSGETPAEPVVPTQPVPVLPESVWKIGSTGDKVREIQKIVGVAQDGVFGPWTQSAVAQWQRNLNIVADGVWGPQTEQATHDLFVFLSNLQAVAPSNPFFEALNDATSQVLREGSSGGSVKILQTGLNGKGYALIADGIFGPATMNAVIRFQSDYGLAVDGIVGPQTWTTLLS
jgi:peptidoglycan hydrolase-like protein with peptidoglycan-binding domain